MTPKRPNGAGAFLSPVEPPVPSRPIRQSFMARWIWAPTVVVC